MSGRLNDTLTQGLSLLGLELNHVQKENLLTYIALLNKWNKVHNLTAIKDPQEMLIRHVLDSLAIAKYLASENIVLDVGTGAGLPGIPLAIAHPDIQFILVDSREKKVNFVQHVVTSLKLGNVEPRATRIENLSLENKPDVIVSRAFASMTDFVNLSSHLEAEVTRYFAMKGKPEQVQEEILPAGYSVFSMETLMVPFLDGQRCLVILGKKEGE